MMVFWIPRLQSTSAEKKTTNQSNYSIYFILNLVRSFHFFPVWFAVCPEHFISSSQNEFILWKLISLFRVLERLKMVVLLFLNTCVCVCFFCLLCWKTHTNQRENVSMSIRIVHINLVRLDIQKMGTFSGVEQIHTCHRHWIAFWAIHTSNKHTCIHPNYTFIDSSFPQKNPFEMLNCTSKNTFLMCTVHPYR